MADIEHQLGRVTGSLDALRVEVKDFRAVSLAAFAGINERLRPLTQDAIQDYRREHRMRQEGRGHSWSQTVILVPTSIVTSLLTALSTVYAGSFGK